MRSTPLLMTFGIEPQRWVKWRMCGGGAARAEETGELGRWSQQQPSPGSAAVCRRRGAEGETFAEYVPAGAEGDVGAAAEAAMAEFLLKILEVMLFLWGARGGEGGAGNMWDVRGVGQESGGQRLGLISRSRLGLVFERKNHVYWEKSPILWIVLERSYAGLGWAGRGNLSLGVRRAFCRR